MSGADRYEEVETSSDEDDQETEKVWCTHHTHTLSHTLITTHTPIIQTHIHATRSRVCTHSYTHSLTHTWTPTFVLSHSLSPPTHTTG